MKKNSSSIISHNYNSHTSPNTSTDSYPKNSIPKSLKLDKFQEIRIKLDKSNYKYHLDSSSLQLAEVLINDVNKYSLDSHKYTDENLKLKNNYENLNINIKAFKNENSRLIKENNELHQQLLLIKKNSSLSSNTKSSQVKKLEDEKNDFKYLYINSREKLESVIIENEELKRKLSKLLNKIYEGNMNESSLRKMFNSDENINKINDNLDQNLDLGIYVKVRGLNMNMNINYETEPAYNNTIGINNNNNEKINEGGSLLKDAIIKTFNLLDGSREREIKSLNTINQTNPTNTLYQTNLIKTMKTFTPGNTISINQPKEVQSLSIDSHVYLEQIKLLEEEINRLQRYMRIEPNENINPNSEIMINFLKKENENLIEKYESRMSVMIKDHKRIENKCEEMNSKIKNYESNHPYVIDLQKKIKNMKEKICEYEKKIGNFNEEIIRCNRENEFLKMSIIKFKENYIEKSFVFSNEERFNKLNENFISNQELISRLHQNVKELTANSNTTERCLTDEVKNLKKEIEERMKEIFLNKNEVQELKNEKEDLIKRTNLYQMNTLKKSEITNELKEQIEQLSKQSVSTEKDKKRLNDAISKLENKIQGLRKELIIKENEIDRLNNNNFVMEKQIQILEVKLNI